MKVYEFLFSYIFRRDYLHSFTPPLNYSNRLFYCMINVIYIMIFNPIFYTNYLNQLNPRRP